MGLPSEVYEIIDHKTRQARETEYVAICDSARSKTDRKRGRERRPTKQLTIVPRKRRNKLVVTLDRFERICGKHGQ